MKKFTLSGLAFGICLATGAVEAAAQDAASGAKVFNRMCKACHTLEPGKNKMGPTLYGVVGRDAGSMENYKYSDALEKSDVVWGEESLSEYLANPRAFLPGTKMIFNGLKDDAQIRDVIAYLQENAG